MLSRTLFKHTYIVILRFRGNTGKRRYQNKTRTLIFIKLPRKLFKICTGAPLFFQVWDSAFNTWSFTGNRNLAE